MENKKTIILMLQISPKGNRNTSATALTPEKFRYAPTINTLMENLLYSPVNTINVSRPIVINIHFVMFVQFFAILESINWSVIPRPNWTSQTVNL